MMWWVVLTKEVKDTIRDRRTLFGLIIFPILFMPAMFYVMAKVEKVEGKKREEHVAKIVVSKSSLDTPLGVELRKLGNSSVIISNDIVKLIRDEKADVGLEVAQPTGALYPAVTIYSNTANSISASMGQRLKSQLKELSDEFVKAKVRQLGVQEKILAGMSIGFKDIATEAERGGFLLGFIIPMYLVMYAIAGGMYTAIDVSAGEKERKTLEALLLTPASKLDLVVGKFLAVSATAMLSIVLSLTSLVFSLKYIGSQQVPLQISAVTFGLMLLAGSLLCVTFAAILIAVAIMAKGFKEAQSYVTQVYLVSLLPVILVSILQTFKPGPEFYLIPVVNAILLFKEILIGKFDSTHILFTFISLVIFAGLAVLWSSRMFQREKTLFRD